MILDINVINRWDKDSFLQLYSNYYKALVSYALCTVNNLEDAEDIVQESFSRLIDHRPSFEDTTRLEAYLYIVVKNRALTFLRDKNRQSAVLVPLHPDNAAIDDDDELFTEAVYKRLFDTIDSLPKREREVLLLVIEGKKNSEIASALGIKSETVRTHKKRAMAYLREYLSAKELAFVAAALAINS